MTRRRTESQRPRRRSRRDAITALFDALETASANGDRDVQFDRSDAQAVHRALVAQVARITQLETELSEAEDALTTYRGLGSIGEMAQSRDEGVVSLTLRRNPRGWMTDAFYLSPDAQHVREDVKGLIETLRERLEEDEAR